MRRFLRQTDLRPNAQREVSDELRFHLEMRTQEFIEAGMSPTTRRAAAQAFGDSVYRCRAPRAAAHVRLMSRPIPRARSGRHVRRAHTAKNAAFTLPPGDTGARYRGDDGSIHRCQRRAVAAIAVHRSVAIGDGLAPLAHEPRKRVAVVIRPVIDALPNATSFSGFAAFRSRPYTVSSDGTPSRFRLAA